MAYEKFHRTRSFEEYFSYWTKKRLEMLTPARKKEIYEEYLLKCKVFQKAKFQCENKLCQTPESKLTLHHIKHKRNGGEDIPENCAAVCKSCHDRFNMAKSPLKLGKITYVLTPATTGPDWKQFRAHKKIIRKQNKHLWGIPIKWSNLARLLYWAFTPYPSGVSA